MDREWKQLQFGLCYQMHRERGEQNAGLGWFFGSLELGIQVDITAWAAEYGTEGGPSTVPNWQGILRVNGSHFSIHQMFIDSVYARSTELASSEPPCSQSPTVRTWTRIMVSQWMCWHSGARVSYSLTELLGRMVSQSDPASSRPVGTPSRINQTRQHHPQLRTTRLVCCDCFPVWNFSKTKVILLLGPVKACRVESLKILTKH